MLLMICEDGDGDDGDHAGDGDDDILLLLLLTLRMPRGHTDVDDDGVDDGAGACTDTNTDTDAYDADDERFNTTTWLTRRSVRGAVGLWARAEVGCCDRLQWRPVSGSVGSIHSSALSCLHAVLRFFFFDFTAAHAGIALCCYW